jgi:hypothetical protein
MTARASMADLITAVRGFTNAGTADFSIGSQAYFTDDQLQAVLDRYATNLYDVQMTAQAQYNSGGSVEYKEYRTPTTWLESTIGGTSRFTVTNGLGSISGTANWSADYPSGIVTFVTDQAGVGRFITGRSYDVYAAAADIWEQKGAAYATAIDFSTDNHSIKRSHIAKICSDMARKYASMATTGGSSSADVVRGDQAVMYMEHEHD